MTYIPANVERGALWLDENVPDWAERVDPYKLVMSNACKCVLGQLDGDYYEVADRFGLSTRDAARLGFWKWGAQPWSALTAGWRTKIAERS